MDFRTTWRVAAAVAAFLALASGEARAQFGYGGFFMPFTPVPSPSQYLYDRSNAQVGVAAATRAAVGSAARNFRDGPNAYFNRVRDFSGDFSYDVGSRQSLSQRSSLAPYAPTLRPPAGSSASRAAAPPKPEREAPPLVTFFRADGSVDWPRDAPADGAVAAPLAEANQALAAVHSEIKGGGTPRAGTLGLARAKLIVYGQQALGRVRDERAAPIGDVFHYYLLFLNQSLDQAGR